MTEGTQIATVQTPPTTTPMVSKKVESGVKKYKLLRGKHIYRDAAGQKVIARKGDKVPLTDTQLKLFKDKFQTPEKSVAESEDES